MNDNANPNDPSEITRRRDHAARSILPVMLSLLPLASITAALEWCALYILTLAKGRDEASAMHERAETELSPDVYAVCDVILASVIGHTAVDALGGMGCGAWEAEYLAGALRAVQGAQETVTGLRHGERDHEGATADVTALDVRERASNARRRSVALAIVATIPHGERAEVLGHLTAWEGVLGGLARACANTNSRAVVDACDAAASDAADTFTTATRAHPDAVTALSSLWHRGDCYLATRGLVTDDMHERRALIDECDAASADLAHVRALLTAAA